MTADGLAASIWMRPERSAVGRPAQWSRAEITGIALRVADADGLEAVSMRRVAAELGTGAASLYRYVETREDLLDLMTDAMGAEYELAPPTGDWLADLIACGEQARAIFRRHRWLAGLAITRPVIGPNGIGLLEHFLTVLQGHPGEHRGEDGGIRDAERDHRGVRPARNRRTPACRRATSPTSATPSPPAGTPAWRHSCPRKHSFRPPKNSPTAIRTSSPAS